MRLLSSILKLVITGRWHLSRAGMSLMIGALAVALSVGVRVADPAPVVALRNLTFDSFQRLVPRAYGDFPVRIVDIDERSLAEIGQWPWPRTQVAALVQRLTDLGAAVIALDIILAEPDRTSPRRMADSFGAMDPNRRQQLAELVQALPDHDEVLAETIAQAPLVVGFATSETPNGRRPASKGGYAFAGVNPSEILRPFKGAVASLPALEAAAQGAGSLSLGEQGSSGVVRRLPLLFSDGQSTYSGLSLEALRVAQGAASTTIRTTGASGEDHGGNPAFVDLKVGEFRVPLTAKGEFVLYFDRDRPERYVSARDLLDPTMTDLVRARIEGQLVFVGTSAAGLLDQRVTALGELVPGVSVHAQAAEQVLSQEFLQRPDWSTGLETVLTVLLCLIVAVLLIVLGARYAAGVITVAIAATFGGAWYAFAEWRLLLDPVFAAVSATVLYFVITAGLYFTTDRDKRFVRDAFARYLAPELLAKLEATPEKLKLGGELRNMTIMFLDIRDFTPISELLSAEQLIDFLNRLFTPLTDAIQRQNGTVDKYIGDSVMAFWNAPVDVPDHAERACVAALEMTAIVDRMNEEDAFGFRARGYPELNVKIGIGLNTGEACVGNMGSERRFNYSVVGDAVNVAARIESSCKTVGAPVLVSDTTAQVSAGLAGRFALLEAGAVPLKGKSEPVKLFALIGDETRAASPHFQQLASEHARLLAAINAGERGAALEALLSCRLLGGKELASFYEVFMSTLRGRVPVVDEEILAIPVLPSDRPPAPTAPPTLRALAHSATDAGEHR